MGFLLFRAIYTVLCWLVLPFVFLRLWIKGRNSVGYRHRWAERIGSYSTVFKQKNKCNGPVLWVHAVSVGEVLAAIPLMKKLESSYPQHLILITTMTPTGSERVLQTFASQLNQKTMLHVYLPYDISCFINRFLAYFKPECGFIMETEIWPNLFWSAIKRKIPVCIVNARLSPNSFGAYLKLKNWVKPVLSKIFVLTQSEADLTRYRALGVLPEHSENMGNIKFDVEFPKNIEEKTEVLRKKFAHQPIWIAASTHAQEEEIVLAAFTQLKKEIENLLLILVPRHPNRFDEVAKLCVDGGWQVARRSQQDWMMHPKIDIYLGDTMGEMLLMYSVSEVAFVGGSLVPVGGHNLLEPALFAVPALTGPILHNFVHISDLLIAANHTQIIQNKEDLAEKVGILLKDKILRNEKGQAGKAVLNKNRGALSKLMDFVENRKLINTVLK